MSTTGHLPAYPVIHVSRKEFDTLLTGETIRLRNNGSVTLRFPWAAEGRDTHMVAELTGPHFTLRVPMSRLIAH